MSDTKKLILCPACGEIMAKTYMPDAGLDLDFCDEGCGGIFFDNGELEQFDNPSKNADEILEVSETKFFNPVDTNITRKCPVCDIPMQKAKISDFEIDICPQCNGKFLDNGEFKKIRDLKELKTLLS